MIFYFSGSGNTKWAAEQLALATHESLHYIPDELRKKNNNQEELTYHLQEGERLGFCFPTHGWQPPRIVREFIRIATFVIPDYTPHNTCHPSIEKSENINYIYALTTCGDNMGHAMRIFNKELNKQGLHTDATFAVVMPESNVCFNFLHLDSPERERLKIDAAKIRMEHICQIVAKRQRGIEELVKGAIPYTYTYVIGGYYNKYLISDKHFWVDKDACIKCGLCKKLCPVGDIEETPPRWLHNNTCTNCLSCYHHCPRHAIHWSKLKRGQYVFKEI